MITSAKICESYKKNLVESHNSILLYSMTTKRYGQIP